MKAMSLRFVFAVLMVSGVVTAAGLRLTEPDRTAGWSILDWVAAPETAEEAVETAHVIVVAEYVGQERRLWTPVAPPLFAVLRSSLAPGGIEYHFRQDVSRSYRVTEVVKGRETAVPVGGTIEVIITEANIMTGAQGHVMRATLPDPERGATYVLFLQVYSEEEGPAFGFAPGPSQALLRGNDLQFVPLLTRFEAAEGRSLGMRPGWDGAFRLTLPELRTLADR